VIAPGLLALFAAAGGGESQVLNHANPCNTMHCMAFDSVFCSQLRTLGLRDCALGPTVTNLSQMYSITIQTQYMYCTFGGAIWVTATASVSRRHSTYPANKSSSNLCSGQLFGVYPRRRELLYASFSQMYSTYTCLYDM
jgi:hypothetical protein